MMAMSQNDDKLASEGAKAPAPVEESRYAREEIIELANGMFGRPSHDVAGALSMLDPSRDEFSKIEVAAALKKYDTHEVVIDRPEAN
jgi:hypothetical protein